MKTILLTEAEIKAIIRSLKSKSSAGYDGISSRILKHGIHFISKPLTYICNRSLETGIFPDRCKFVTVRPIYKKGDKKDITNYSQYHCCQLYQKF